MREAIIVQLCSLQNFLLTRKSRLTEFDCSISTWMAEQTRVRKKKDSCSRRQRGRRRRRRDPLWLAKMSSFLDVTLNRETRRRRRRRPNWLFIREQSDGCVEGWFAFSGRWWWGERRDNLFQTWSVWHTCQSSSSKKIFWVETDSHSTCWFFFSSMHCTVLCNIVQKMACEITCNTYLVQRFVETQTWMNNADLSKHFLNTRSIILRKRNKASSSPTLSLSLRGEKLPDLLLPLPPSYCDTFSFCYLHPGHCSSSIYSSNSSATSKGPRESQFSSTVELPTQPLSPPPSLGWAECCQLGDSSSISPPPSSTSERRKRFLASSYFSHSSDWTLWVVSTVFEGTGWVWEEVCRSPLGAFCHTYTWQ